MKVKKEAFGSLKCEACGCPVFYIIFFKKDSYTVCQKCGTITTGGFALDFVNEDESGGGTA